MNILTLGSVFNKYLKYFELLSVEQSSTIIISIFFKDWFWILLIDFKIIFSLLYEGRIIEINGLLEKKNCLLLSYLSNNLKEIYK